MSNKFTSIEDITKKYNIIIDEEDKEFSKEIITILNSDDPEKLDLDLDNVIILNWIGLYYEIHPNVGLMKKYYELGVEKGSIGCMICLGIYYQTEEKNYDLVKKYFLMGVELGNSRAMRYLGDYYAEIEHDAINSKKYYELGGDVGDHDGNLCLIKLASRYQLGAEYDLMEQYYQKAIKNGSIDAMFNLGVCYAPTCKNQIIYNGKQTIIFGNTRHPTNIELMLKYLTMAIEKNYYDALHLVQNVWKVDYLTFYNYLVKIENKSQIIYDEIKNLQLLHDDLLYL